MLRKLKCKHAYLNIVYDYEAVMLFINNSFFIINMIKRKLNADSNEIDVGVFSPEEKCMGKTYGQYLAESWNKLVSDDPDISDDPGTVSQN